MCSCTTHVGKEELDEKHQKERENPAHETDSPTSNNRKKVRFTDVGVASMPSIPEAARSGFPRLSLDSNKSESCDCLR